MAEYTQAQADKADRLSLTPAELCIALDETDSPIVTGVPSTGTPVKVEGGDVLDVTKAVDFSYDVGNDRFYFSRSGAVDVPFVIALSQSFSQTASSAEVTVRVTKNGTPILGAYAKRTIVNSGTRGTISIGPLCFTLSENDYAEVYVESNKTGDFNAWAFSTRVVETA